MFRGREITHPQLGLGLLKRMAESVQGMASLERQPIMEGKRLHMILSPITTHKAKVTEEKKEPQHAEVKNT